MKKILLFIAFFYGMHHELYAQATPAEDGVVSFSLPIRNSLKFNRFVVNPTFSFVREQNTVASIFSKRQWVQFDNAPTTYFASYSGRFLENQGVGLGVFKQNYGILATFGAIANFTHNVVLEQDSNLTFGLNLGAYKSGLDAGKVITNGVADPSLNNIPSNFLLTVSPGINYGTTFLDFGLALNNIVSYNFSTSNMLQDDPEKAIQAHMMYTGYLDTYGFFDKSKFSALVRSEFKKDKTVLSGLAMFSIPMGVWAQAGYNTLYGLSGGIGFNITSSISIEYNFEKAMGGFDNFGSSHDIVLAYKFKNKSYYYGDDEEEGALIKPSEAPTKPSAKPATTQPKQSTLLSPVDKANLEAARKEAQAAREAIRQAKLKEIADAKAKADAEAKAKLAADAKAKADAEALRLKQEKLAADAKLKADAEAKAKAAVPTAAEKAAAEKARLAKLAADAKVKADAEAAQKAAADKAKADAEAERVRQAKLAADAKAKADAEATQKAAADAKAKADAEAERVRQAKLAADAKAKADAEAAQKAAADAKAKADAEAERLRQAKLAADAKAKADAEAAQKAAAEAKAKADAEAERLRQEKLAADAKAKADAEAAQKAAADAKAKADAEAERLRQEKLAADAKAKADAEAERVRQAKLAADAKAKADAEAAQKAAAEAKAKADAEAERLRQEKLAADAKAKADAEAERVRQAKLVADAKAKADAEAAQKAAADAKAKADAEAERLRQEKLAADAKAKADAEAERIRLAKLAAAAAAAPIVKDESAKAIDVAAKQAEESGKMQKSLIAQLDQKVANKAKELREMKEENDLSEQGIVREPQEIKSPSNDNAAIESLKSQITALNKMQDDNINRIKNLYDERIKKGASATDALSVSYLKSIDQLKAEQATSVQSNSKLLQTLENIKVAVEIEKKRRIKRANSLSDTDRFAQDQATLKRIKETTKVSPTPLKESDFDFGDEQSNMQIMKRVANTESAFYVVLAVHKDVAKRDKFLAQMVASGERNVSFFYDANTSSYYIYATKFETIQEAQGEMANKGKQPFTSKMAIIKVEN